MAEKIDLNHSRSSAQAVDSDEKSVQPMPATEATGREESVEPPSEEGVPALDTGDIVDAPADGYTHCPAYKITWPNNFTHPLKEISK